MAEADRLVPELQVRIDGADLPAPAAADVLWASVQEDVDLPAMFVAELINWDPDTIAMKWSDGDLFDVGGQIEIKMGYRNQLATLLAGEITALELSVDSTAIPTLIVQGYDRSHRLLRGRRTCSLTNVTDADIARSIASRFGLRAQVDDTHERFAYVQQYNQSDLDFLRSRAKLIGYEVVVRDKTLIFRPRPIMESASATLSRERDLLEFRPRLSTIGQHSSVAIRGWNALDKKSIAGNFGLDDSSPSMSGGELGARSNDRLFGTAAFTSVARPVATQAEADTRARERFGEIALSYIAGDGLCVGRTDLRAGIVVCMEGLGKRFSGGYYVTSTTHTYAPSRGYRTRFTVRRNAS